ncbi:hypothetical protein [Gimesia panareensis]|uniref:Type II secretion system protein D n=1 Tax=Gimesia panareensis TaxID=2527978 RepID=A0A517Q152_9PLAN|nr:hypothetical protein [Gimesia panareensis]QDT25367.1 hypothetical protein Enr10x_06620 [Gimesia panareensis]QDU48327.1 hypothetical protein Pan110_06400 [Gimesia panareensis]QDV18573.1 hypothetical protein Pan153_32320 [Gimesia panareensis]
MLPQLKYRIFCILGLLACGLVITADAEEKQKAKSKPTVKTSAQKPLAAAGKLQPLFFPPLTPREQILANALQMPSNAEFNEVPLKNVIQFYSDLHKVPIIIQKTDIVLNLDLSIDLPITANFSELSLRDTLLQILEPLDLTFVVERDMIQILTREKASQLFKTRVYPVGDLCVLEEDYQALADAIQNANLGDWKQVRLSAPAAGTTRNQRPEVPQQGAGRGFFYVQSMLHLSPADRAETSGLSPMSYFQEPGGTISIVTQSKSLVISQTYHAHNGIVQLLEQLRQAKALNQ